MLFLFLSAASSEQYPLILGVSEDTFVPNPSVLGVTGILPDKLCVFIIGQFEEPQITTLKDLSTWNNMIASKVCSAVGKMVEFPSVESNIFNFVEKMKEMYESKMVIDAGNECTCKIGQFREGLVIVKVPDSEPRAVDEVIGRLPEGTAIAFVASTPTLFKD